MTTDDELAAWGEPPVGADEQALLALLDRLLEKRSRGEVIRPGELAAASPALSAEAAGLIGAAECIEAFVADVLEKSDILGDAEAAPCAATQTYEGPFAAAPEGFGGPVPAGYRIRAFLGEGKFGKVWLADHLRFDIPVALKTLHLPTAGDARSQALAVLENEARVMARLNHPNVVRVFALEQIEGHSYLVLQYIDGGSLQDRLEKDGPLGWQAAARYIADVGEGLMHAHAEGVVHRDVKPANILWDRRRNEALLTDFGLAARLAESGVAAGTPLYMAPEAFDGRSTPAGDVYGLAASLFALTTGRVPFLAATRRELLEKINQGMPDTEPLFAGMPEALERVILSGLAASPAQRPDLPTFVGSLRGALNRLLAASLPAPHGAAAPAAPVNLLVRVARRDGRGAWTPVAATRPESSGLTRNMILVPPAPEQVGVRTGDRVRIEVLADREGFVTVFNVGPAGQLNLLHPDPAQLPAAPPVIRPGQPLHVLDVALTPPAGREHLFAVWSRQPLPLSLEDLFRLAQGPEMGVSPPYRATRNMERVQGQLIQLRREDWHVVVLEIDHGN